VGLPAIAGQKLIFRLSCTACHNRKVKTLTPKHKWTFRARFRYRAFGWKGSRLACQRLKEAVVEIKKVAKADHVTAADGAVILMEKIWPALEFVDSSSGALGGSVGWTLTELLPIVIDAPADRKTRDDWLARLFQAIQEDGVDYLWLVQERWGELCGSDEVASHWADEFLPELKAAWSDPRSGSYVRETPMCLSSLLAARRYDALLLLAPVDAHHQAQVQIGGTRKPLTRAGERWTCIPPLPARMFRLQGLMRPKGITTRQSRFASRRARCSTGVHSWGIYWRRWAIATVEAAGRRRHRL
jgi:hypothetical protein